VRWAGEIKAVRFLEYPSSLKPARSTIVLLAKSLMYQQFNIWNDFALLPEKSLATTVGV